MKWKRAESRGESARSTVFPIPNRWNRTNQNEVNLKFVDIFYDNAHMSAHVSVSSGIVCVSTVCDCASVCGMRSFRLIKFLTNIKNEVPLMMVNTKDIARWWWNQLKFLRLHYFSLSPSRWLCEQKIKMKFSIQFSSFQLGDFYVVAPRHRRHRDQWFGVCVCVCDT